MRRIHVAVTVAAAALLSLSCSERSPLGPSSAERVAQTKSLIAPLPRTCTTLAALQAEADLVFGKKSPNSNSVRGKIDLIDKALAKEDLAQARDHAFKAVDFILKQAKDKKGVQGTAAQVASLTSHIFCYAGLGITITDPQNAIIVEPSPTPQIVTNTDATAGVSFPPNALTETTVLEFVRITDLFAPGNGPLLTMLDQYPGFFVISASSATNAPLAQPVVVGVCPAPGIDPVVRARLRLGHQVQPDSAHFQITPAADASFLQCPTQTAAIDRLPGWLRAVATLVLPRALYARPFAAFSRGVGGTAGEFSPFGPVDLEVNLVPGGVGGTAGEFLRAPTQDEEPQRTPSSPTTPAPNPPPVLKRRPSLRSNLLDGSGACIAIDAPWGTPVDTSCRPVLTVRTHLGTPLAGVPVMWSRGPVSGKVASSTAGACGVLGDSVLTTTDLAGKARICWTLGDSVGTSNNTVVARPHAGGDAPVGVTFVPPSMLYTATALRRASMVLISCFDSLYNGNDRVPCSAVARDPANNASIAAVPVTYGPTTPPHDAGTYTADASYGGSPLYVGSVAAQQTVHILPSVPMNYTWTGAVDTNWSAPGNWSPFSVPAALDSAFIPLTASQPVLSANDTIAALVLQSGATLDVGVYTLTVTGGLDAGDTIVGSSGSVVAEGNGTLRGTFAVPLTARGTHTLSGPLTVTHGDGLTIMGTLRVNGFALTTTDLVVQSSTGSLVMDAGSDSVTVNGNASFVAGTSPLSRGVLDLKGNLTLTSPGRLVASLTHRTRFSASAGTQTLTFRSWSTFQNLEFSNAGSKTISTNGYEMTVAGALVVHPTSPVVRGALPLNDPMSDVVTINGSLVDSVGMGLQVNEIHLGGVTAIPTAIRTGSLHFKGPLTLPASLLVDGNVRVYGTNAELNLGGNSMQLTAAKVFDTYRGGRLVMQNDLDSLIVGTGGNIGFYGGRSVLTAGTIVVPGYFNQGPLGPDASDPQAFAATGSHRTVFVGTSYQVIKFANASFSESHFAQLVIDSTATVSLQSNVFAETFVTSAGPSRRISGNPGQATLTTMGLDVGRLTSAGVPIVFVDGAGFTKFQNVTFQNMDPAATQLGVSRTGGTYGLQSITFSSVPSTGVYLRAEDTAVDGDVLAVNFAGVSPLLHHGRISLVGGALTDWPGAFTWTGATSTDWKTASNWSPSSVPMSTDDVVIPYLGPSANYPLVPALQTGPSVRNIMIAPSARLTVSNNTSLRVLGDYVADATSVVTTICCGSYIGFHGSVSGAAYQTIRGAISNAIAFAEVRLVGRTTASSFQASGSSATVDLNGHTLQIVTVGSSFSAYSGGRLKMTNALDSLIADYVNFTATAGNSTGLLANGVISTQSFLQAGTSGALFAPTGNHLTVLRGAAAARMEDPGSFFNHLRVLSGATVNLLTDVKVSGDLSDEGSTSGSIGFTSAVGTRTLTSGGLLLSNPALAKSFINVMLRFVDGTANASVETTSFRGFPSGFTGTALEVQRTGGTYTFQNLDFASVPLTAWYLRAEDTAPGDGNVLTVNFTGVAPAFHGGRIVLAGGALTNWLP